MKGDIFERHFSDEYNYFNLKQNSLSFRIYLNLFIMENYEIFVLHFIGKNAKYLEII